MALEFSADVFQRTSCCLSWCGEFGADYKEKPLISQEISGFYGTNGDTELFKKSRNINSFRARRIANNLY